jgi:hypothetical protein
VKARPRSPKGLNYNHFVYFCCQNIFIRGQNELRKMSVHQFKLHLSKSNEDFQQKSLLFHFLLTHFCMLCMFYLLFIDIKNSSLEAYNM